MNTKQELINRINTNNNEESKGVRVFRHVHAFIAKQVEEGKTQVNGWWEKRATKYFEQLGWSIRFHRIAGQYYMLVWGGDSGYTFNNEVRMFLGFDGDVGNLTTETFVERNSCWGKAAEDRMARRTALTASDNDQWLNQAAMRIEAYKLAKKALEEFMGDSYHNEAFYIIRDLAGLSEGR